MNRYTICIPILFIKVLRYYIGIYSYLYSSQKSNNSSTN